MPLPLRFHRTFVVCLGLLFFPFLTMCGSPTPPEDKNQPLDYRATVPTPLAPEEGHQVVMPDTIIPKGSEKMICWIPDWTPDKDYYAIRFEGLQGKMGHHVVAMASGVPRKAGEVFDCTDPEKMVSLKPLLLPEPAKDSRVLPDNFAVRLPKDSKIVIQSHYVNTNERDIKVADVARFHFLKDTSKLTEVSYLIMNHGGFQLPQGKQEVKMSCPIEKKMNIMVMLGHMHEFGTSFQVELERKGERRVLYSVDKWLVDFRDEPPLTFFKDEKALTLEPGDTLHAQCHFNNTSQGSLSFPAEMCSMIAYYYPALPEGLITCNAK